MTDRCLGNFITGLHEENQKVKNVSKTMGQSRLITVSNSQNKDTSSGKYELGMSKEEFEARNYPDNILRVCDGKVRYYDSDRHYYIPESALHYYLPELSPGEASGSEDNLPAKKEAHVSKQKRDTEHTTTKGSGRSKVKTLHSKTESKNTAQKDTGKGEKGSCKSQTEQHEPILTIVTWGDPMSDSEPPTDLTMSGWGDAISDTELPTNSKRKPKS